MRYVGTSSSSTRLPAPGRGQPCGWPWRVPAPAGGIWTPRTADRLLRSPVPVFLWLAASGPAAAAPSSCTAVRLFSQGVASHTGTCKNTVDMCSSFGFLDLQKPSAVPQLNSLILDHPPKWVFAASRADNTSRWCSQTFSPSGQTSFQPMFPDCSPNLLHT